MVMQTQNSRLSRLYEVVDVGEEGVIVGIAGGALFGAATALYSFLQQRFSFIPETNVLLFVLFGAVLTASVHYAARLGLLVGAVFFTTVRVAQILLGVLPLSADFLMLVIVWSILQVMLIGYIPGKIILTSESLWLMVRGLSFVSLFYSAAEYIIKTVAVNAGINPASAATVLLVFPFASIPLLALVSGTVTFILANTFCPYMMLPLISRGLGKENEGKYCGAQNYVYNTPPLSIGEEKIQRAKKRGFKLISDLPSFTVFECPRGGVVTAYKSGKILIRRVSKESADRLFNSLSQALAS